MEDNERDQSVHVAARYCELCQMLRRMMQPSVRSDFLAGRMINCQDAEKMLTLIDGIHNLLLPPWTADKTERNVAAQETGKHFAALLEESEDIFYVPTI